MVRLHVADDQLSMLVAGVVAAGAAPGACWFGWACKLMAARVGEASQMGLVRMCGALEVAEVWPGQAWAQACLLQVSTRGPRVGRTGAGD